MGSDSAHFILRNNMINKFIDKITGKAAKQAAEAAAAAELVRIEAERKEAAAKAEKAEARRLKAEEKKNKKTAKEIATENQEPYVNIDSVSIDPANPGQGAFELDWNSFFIAKLTKAGYQGKDDEQIVDQWFQEVCRNIVLETYEQHEAQSPQRVHRRELGDGRSEIS